MASQGFESLEVYQLAERLADAVWEVVGAWPAFAKSTMGAQLVRAADSIGANIAEGSGRQSYNDNRRFIRIARASLCETKHFLRRAYKRRLLDESTVASLKQILDELGPRLNAYLRSIGPTTKDHPQNTKDK